MFFGFVMFLTHNGNSGELQVTSVPRAHVYIDGKLIGDTPLCKCQLGQMLPTGDYNIKVVPMDGSAVPFESKITIEKKILTVVDRVFGSEGVSEGSLITLKPILDNGASEISVTSFPEDVYVYLDKNPVGQTPLLLRHIALGDHDVFLKKTGYKSKLLQVQTSLGYRLEATAFLGVDLTGKNDNNASSSSANLSPPVAIPTVSISKKVVILDTPTGFLRVRILPSANASESARVTGGEVFEEVASSSGWLQIKLPNGSLGWISGQYAKRQ